VTESPTGRSAGAGGIGATVGAVVAVAVDDATLVVGPALAFAVASSVLTRDHRFGAAPASAAVVDFAGGATATEASAPPRFGLTPGGGLPVIVACAVAPAVVHRNSVVAPLPGTDGPAAPGGP
jgi:hypothetical protein